MGNVQRHSWMVVVIAGALTGCSDWTPVRNARDVEGQSVKVESRGKEVAIDAVVLCDDAGFIIASQVSDCRDSPQLTFDTRRDKVLVVNKDTKSSVGVLVAGILTAIVVPIAIVGSAILSSH